MGGPDPAGTAEESPEGRKFREVVPARAVLTELARGFLLMQKSDPGRAAQFAQTFLRERSTSAAPASRLVPPGHLAVVRRGVTSAIREGP